MDLVKESAKDLAFLHGLLMKSVDMNHVENVSVTILPSKFPESLYNYVVRVQKDFHILFNKISRDYAVLKDILKQVIENDDFVKRLWNIYEIIVSDGLIQPIFLGLIRNDYMVHIPTEFSNYTCSLSDLFNKPGVSIKQVEYNLMASSFAGLSQNIVEYHRLNLMKLDGNEEVNQLPPNKSCDGLAKGLVCAWQKYGNKNAIILFVVASNERNVYDQRLLSKSINEQNPKIRVLFRTFEYCYEHGILNTDKILTINGEEVGVIYFRHGYVPAHYYDEKIWESKLMLERSRAIKSPSIQHMLVNTKLVQQALTQHNLMKRYLPDAVAVDIAETFFDQYLLDDDPEIIQQALLTPENFVLKPQREGGGNNYFEEDLVEKLKSIVKTDEKFNYVLMKRINPPKIPNHVLLSTGEIKNQNLVSELGIFGVFLGSDTDIYANYQCGHLLRSKKFDVNETGVAAGFGYIDSPYLI